MMYEILRMRRNPTSIFWFYIRLCKRMFEYYCVIKLFGFAFQIMLGFVPQPNLRKTTNYQLPMPNSQLPIPNYLPNLFSIPSQPPGIVFLLSSPHQLQQ